jgi:hypothetical protein
MLSAKLAKGTLASACHHALGETDRDGHAFLGAKRPRQGEADFGTAADDGAGVVAAGGAKWPGIGVT